MPKLKELFELIR